MTPSAVPRRPGEAIPLGLVAGDAGPVIESPSPAEEFPGLYRTILDGVAELERIGDRREAMLVRAAATAVYSKSWDAGNRRRLEALSRRIARGLGDVGQHRSRTRRLAPARRRPAWAPPGSR
jgi:hypothetical protein